MRLTGGARADWYRSFNGVNTYSEMERGIVQRQSSPGDYFKRRSIERFCIGDSLG